MLNQEQSGDVATLEERAAPTSFDLFHSPLGELLLIANDDSLLEIRFPEAIRKGKLPQHCTQSGALCATAVAQLKAYFAGDLQTFDLPLAPQGTSFQKLVWKALLDIPYGKTISYGEVAHRIDRPTASRAVGAANGQNPLPIVIPCHRVIGSNGSLTGYGGGLHRKETLLELESPSPRT